MHPPEEKEKEEENISPSEYANVYYNKIMLEITKCDATRMQEFKPFLNPNYPAISKYMFI